jgi:hypothetical protein
MSTLGENACARVLGEGDGTPLGFHTIIYVVSSSGEDALGAICLTLTINSILCGALDLGVCEERRLRFWWWPSTAPTS